MDFTNRNVHSPSANKTAPGAADVNGNGKKSKGDWSKSPGWLRIVWIVLLFAVTILIASMTALLLLNNNKGEAGYIDKDRVQAVFLDNGQVYFGKIRTITNSYVDLQGIYYLSVDQPVQPETEETQVGNITLQKLGCELHGPVDQMLINRDHVTFWENLRDDGQVSQAIAQWIEQNPEGLECPSPDEQQTGGQDQTEVTPGEEDNQE